MGRKGTSTLGPELLLDPPPPQNPPAPTAVCPGQQPAGEAHAADPSHPPSPAALGPRSTFLSNRLHVAAESRKRRKNLLEVSRTQHKKPEYALRSPGLEASCRPAAPRSPAALTFVPVVQLLQLLPVHPASHGCLEASVWVRQKLVCGRVCFPLILRYVAGHGEEMP